MRKRALIFIGLSIVIPFIFYMVNYYRKLFAINYPYKNYEYLKFERETKYTSFSFDSRNGNLITTDSLGVDTLYLSFDSKQFRQVFDSILNIKFFKYPEKFVPPGGREEVLATRINYEIGFGEKTKNLLWERNLESRNIKAEDLREISLWLENHLKSLATK
jgi:hypothetical protein